MTGSKGMSFETIFLNEFWAGDIFSNQITRIEQNPNFLLRGAWRLSSYVGLNAVVIFVRALGH